MTTTSEAQDDDDYTIPMEPELRESFTILARKLVELHIVWQQYRQLYGQDDGTIDVLNRTAGLFFKIVQDELWDSVLLRVCRMTDPAAQGKNKNLTIWSLHSLITDATFKAEVEKQCQAADDAAEFARSHRNKRIAHQDHGYTTNSPANPLSPVSRDRVEEMLKALRGVMNLIHGHYDGIDFQYDKFVDYSGARKLVAELRQLEHLRNNRT